jgi:hypothetical protein
MSKITDEITEEEFASLTPWQRGMMEFHREGWKDGGQGVFQLGIIRQKDVLPMIFSGDLRFLKIIREWFEYVAEGRRPLCLACEWEFGPQTEQPTVPAFCFMLPFDDEKATRATVTGICERCAEREDRELTGVAYEQLRKMGFAKRKFEIGEA